VVPTPAVAVVLLQFGQSTVLVPRCVLCWNLRGCCHAVRLKRHAEQWEDTLGNLHTTVLYMEFGNGPSGCIRPVACSF